MPSKTPKQVKFMRAVAHSPKFAKKVGVSQSVGKDFEMADKKKMKKFRGGGSMPKDPVTGGRGTVPMDADRKAFLEQMRKQNQRAQDEGAREGRAGRYATRTNAKGGKVAAKYAKGGKVVKKADGGMMPMAQPTARVGTTGPMGSPPAAGMMGGLGGMRSSPMGDMRPANAEPMRDEVKTPGAMRRDARQASNQGMMNRAAVQAMRDARVRGPMAAGATDAQAAAPAMKKGGKAMTKGKSCYAKGGGVEKRGKTKGTMVKMAKGGSIDGIAMKGRTRCKGAK